MKECNPFGAENLCLIAGIAWYWWYLAIGVLFAVTTIGKFWGNRELDGEAVFFSSLLMMSWPLLAVALVLYAIGFLLTLPTRLWRGKS